MKDYALEFEVRVENTLKDLRECLKKVSKGSDCCKELLSSSMEDYDEIWRTYEAELATLRAELE